MQRRTINTIGKSHINGIRTTLKKLMAGNIEFQTTQLLTNTIYK